MAFLSGHMLYVINYFPFSKSEKVMCLSGAGFETTSSTMMWWVLAMVAFPEVQRRGQAELDDVVGRARPPTFADAPHLPYVRAVIKEVLRWRPAVERGLPHKAAEDDWYEGMFIPKGATCIANIWQCNHDRAIFGDDADDFRPERYLDAKGKELLPGPREAQEGHVTYGFGRRVCVGKALANDSLFINSARILWAATLDCARGENEKELRPDTNAFLDKGVITLVLLPIDQFWDVTELLECRHPAPHDCIITPRFPEALSILAEQSESFED